MRKNVGWVVLATLGFYLLSVLVPFVISVATALAWLVPLLMWRTLGKNAFRQTLLLLFAGITLLLFSVGRGVFLGWENVFTANLPLLAMFVAVSFLSLTTRKIEDPALPKGNRAVVTTAIGTHLLGAVINLSVLFVFGDRLQKNGTLSRVQLIVLARCFSAAAWWSPFFIATGVALTYAPAMNWQETLIPGAIMSMLAIGYSIVEVCYFRRTEFSGYPLKTESLIVPVFLAVAVMCVHHFLQHISILNIICVIAPAGSLIFMKNRPRFAALRDFIDNGIASVSSQFALFLAAGVFSAGITSLTHVYPALFSIQSPVFSPLLFAILSGVMIVVGILGVHPIISIAIVSPLLLPLNPDHSQLAFLFLTVWAVATGCSPLSGVGLALVSRYRASPRVILYSNWQYVVVMWVIASAMNVFFFTEWRG